jgi:hypothetical protein
MYLIAFTENGQNYKTKNIFNNKIEAKLYAELHLKKNYQIIKKDKTKIWGKQ